MHTLFVRKLLYTPTQIVRLSIAGAYTVRCLIKVVFILRFPSVITIGAHANSIPVCGIYFFLYPE